MTAAVRPILLGMVNPHSDDPARALWPDPPGCSGWRLWKMTSDAGGMTQEEYVRAFDRRNLLPGREWDAGAACVAGRDFRARSRGKIVVVLGAAVWRALGFGAALEPRQRLGSGGAGWLYLPHPSGRSRHYNDQLNRWWAGKTLVELAAPRAS